MITARRVVRGLMHRTRRLIKGNPLEPTPLEMVFPQDAFATPIPVNLAPGYRMRQWDSAHYGPYFDLLAAAGMRPPDMAYWEDRVLPDGFFVVEHEASGSLVATCLAAHRPAGRHPRAGALGWLAGDPSHAGHKLGRSVSAAVTSRLIAAGYRRLYLETHDFRLSAIKVYLQLGWVPLLYAPDMELRWRAVCERLDEPCTPERWLH